MRRRVISTATGLIAWLASIVDELREIGRPLFVSARLIWRAGIVFLAVFLLVYTLWNSLGDWALAGFYRLVGPHEVRWWEALDPPTTFLADLVVEPIRIGILAAAFDYCLRRHEQRRAAETDDDIADELHALEFQDD